MEKFDIEEIEKTLKQLRDLKLKKIDLGTQLVLTSSEASRLRDKVVPYLYDDNVRYLFYKYGEIENVRDIFIAMNKLKQIVKSKR